MLQLPDRFQVNWLILIPLALFAVLQFSQLQSMDGDATYRFQGDGYRLLTTVDGFFYERLTDDLLNHRYTPVDPARDAMRPVPVPSIVQLTAALVRLTGLDLHTVTFFLPPLLAMLAIPLMWGWSRKLFPDNPLASVVAACAVSINFSWFTRTTLGKFDTDGLNLVLLLAISFCLHDFSTRDGNQRYLSLGLAGLFLIILAYWWIPVGLPFGLLIFLFFACTLVTPTNAQPFDRYFKTAILAGACLGAVILALGLFTSLLPPPLASMLNPYLAHLSLIKGETSSMFPAMGKTIAELRNLDFITSVNWVCGSVYVAPVAAIGLALLGWKQRPSLFMIIAPAALFAALSVTGVRFLMFLAPAVGFGLGAFMFYAVPPLLRKLPFRWNEWLGVAVACLLILPSARMALGHKLRPSFDTNQISLPALVNGIAQENATIWNWWGPGYMLEEYGKRRTFIDGGMQEPERSWIAAVPLASHNYALARNWMRFFAKNPRGLNTITRDLKSRSKADACQFLLKALQGPEHVAGALEEYPMRKDRDWSRFLYPDVEVYLVLINDMLTHGSWLSIGNHVPGTEASSEDFSFYAIPVNRLRFNKTRGQLLLADGKTIPIKRFYTITPTELRHDRFDQPGKVVVGIWGTDFIMYMNEDHLNSLALQLLFVHPQGTPGFTPLRFNPFAGGVWKVN